MSENLKLNQRDSIFGLYMGGDVNAKILLLVMLKDKYQEIHEKLNLFKLNNMDYKDMELELILKYSDLSYFMKKYDIKVIGKNSNLESMMIYILNNVDITREYRDNNDELRILKYPIFKYEKDITKKDYIKFSLSPELLEYIDSTNNYYFINIEMMKKIDCKMSINLYNKMADASQRNYKDLRISRDRIAFLLNISSKVSNSRLSDYLNKICNKLNENIEKLNLTYEVKYATDENRKEIISSYIFSYNIKKIKELTTIL